MIRPVSSESSWLPRIRWTRSGYWHLSAATTSRSWCERSPLSSGYISVPVDQLLQDQVPRRDGGRVPASASTFLNAGRLPCRSPTTITSVGSLERDDAARASGRRRAVSSVARRIGGQDFAGSGMRAVSNRARFASPVCFQGGLPVLVERFQLLFSSRWRSWVPTALTGSRQVAGWPSRSSSSATSFSSSPISRSISAALR